jgi:hypothetical protein
LPTNPWRDSWESHQSNAINNQLLAAVNEILPVYGRAKFRSEHDSTEVTQILTKLLKDRLPPRKLHQPYLGEWKSVSWTDKDLQSAFQGMIEVPSDQTLRVRSFNTDVPIRLEEAVTRSYKVKRMTWKDRTNTFGIVI